jgi:steroid 5-alpha reductase family enzyme
MSIIIGGLVLLFIYLCSMVAFVQWRGDTSIGNFTWGGGVMLVTLYTFFTMGTFLLRQLLLTTMIILWAGRLVVHVYMRYTGKDPRFALWQWHGLKALVINSGWIFGQIGMIAIMSCPMVLVNSSKIPGLTIFDILGIILWTFGFCFEAISDYQLFDFMHNSINTGRVMRFGLWQYSRHPNYFGEVVMWWSVYLIALSVPYGWAAIIAPATITYLLLFVTGIPWVEKALENNYEYQQYKQTTSAFIPWFPKK